MTRKDYEKIAEVFSLATMIKPKDKNQQLGAEAMRRLLAESMADTLAEENPRFDRDRFLAACGVQ